MDAPAPVAEPPVVSPAGDAGRHAAQRPRLRRVLFAQRGVVVRVHRWLSFALLAWILLESVTGAVLVFDHEIDRWWNGSHFATTEGDVGADQAIEAARDARPGEPIRYVVAPGADGTPSYEVGTAGRNGDAHVVLVDPGSGRVTADDHHPPVLMEYLLDLHVDLNSTSVFGMEATRAVAWLGIGWLLVLVSGFYVWYWPRLKRWARALRVRRAQGRFAFHLDLHNAIGIATILPMTLIVLTGVNFVFHDQVASVYEVITFGTYEEADTTVALSQPTDGAPISAGEASRIVAGLDPAVDVEYVFTPAGSPTGTYSVYTTVDGSFFGMVGGAHEVEFDVDQYSGRILSIHDPLDGNGATQAFDDWSYPVHVGTFGGTITRWLWLVIGLTPFALAWTGVVMWLVRRRRLRARAVRTAPVERSRSRPDPGARRMTRPLRLASTLTVAALVLAGCGSTRFVVVEQGAGAAASDEGASSASAAPSSTTAPATGAPSAKDARAIRTTIARALAVDDRPMRERLPYLEPDAEDLAETYAAVQKVVAGFTIELEVDDIATTGADTATATVSVLVDGASFASGLPVTLVRNGERWHVTRAGACTLLALASPCPEAAAS